MTNRINKVTQRDKRRLRIRHKVTGTPETPRLSIYRSLKHIYAQLIDDVSGKTLASASSLIDKSTGNVSSATKIGKQIAEKAIKLNINKVVFDRGGYQYHGQIKAVAEAAREAGLKF